MILIPLVVINSQIPDLSIKSSSSIVFCLFA
nr:MAG TPA: hypothetical protein [Caudoviricetes sp.]